MERPEQHEIDTEAGRIFPSVLPKNWQEHKSPSPEYGIDFEIEVFEDHKTTGLLFKVQLKGTKSADFIENGNLLTFQLPVKSANYFCNELRLPLVFVLCEVTTKRLWWAAPQMDADFRARLNEANAKGQQSLVLHVPARNVFPDTTNQLVEVIASCEVLNSAKMLKDSPAGRFSEAVSALGDRDGIVRAFQEKIDVVRINQVEELVAGKNYEESAQISIKIYENPESTIEMRCSALFFLEKAVAISLRDQGAPASALHEHFYNCSGAKKELTRRGPRSLKRMAMIENIAAKLSIYTESEFGQFMNWQVNREKGDPFWLANLIVARQQLCRKLLKAYERALSLLSGMIKDGDLHLVPHCVIVICNAMQTFVLRLWFEKLREAALVYQRSIREMAQFAISISAQMGRWDEISILVGIPVMIAEHRNPSSGSVSESLEWAKAQLEKVPDPARRAGYLKEVENMAVFFAKGPPPLGPEGMDLEAERQIYEGMAKGLGIDLDNPDDKIAMVVRVGIADLSPERVLKDCRHLFVRLAGGGMVAEWMKLPTAGFKRIHCTLHGYGVQGLSLDDTYRVFKQLHCSKCSDAIPHPPDWKWTKTYQRIQDELQSKPKPPPSPGNEGELRGGIRIPKGKK